jgi:hypothetical protein
MNEVVKFSENLPKVRAQEQTFRDASTIIERWHRAQSEGGRHGRNEHLIATIDELTPAVDKLCTQLAKLNEPATKRDIANHLAVLLKSFPNAGKDNAEVFGRMLVEDVAAMLPTIGGLEAACRHLRRTNRFIPVIAEVLTALEAAEASQRLSSRILSSFPEYRRKITAQIAHDKEANERYEREMLEHERRKALDIAHQDDPDNDIPF